MEARISLPNVLQRLEVAPGDPLKRAETAVLEGEKLQSRVLNNNHAK